MLIPVSQLIKNFIKIVAVIVLYIFHTIPQSFDFTLF